MTHDPAEFFKGIAVEFWNKIASAPQTEAEVAFLQDVLALEPGARVLDVPCGSGRHALALAQLGYRMTGVDVSEESLAIAKHNARTRNVSIEWQRAEMRDLPWAAAFDAAYCFGNSFGYLDPAGTEAFLAAVSRALEPGGRFAFDSGAVAESLLPNLELREWWRVDDILLLTENRYELLESRLDTTYTFIRNGREEARVHSHYVYTLSEIKRMLERAGLQVIETFASFDKKPYEVNNPLLYLVAGKRS